MSKSRLQNESIRRSTEGVTVSTAIWLIILLLDFAGGTIRNEYFNYPLYRLHYGGNFKSLNSTQQYFPHVEIYDPSSTSSLNLTRDTLLILLDTVFSHALPYENHLRYFQGKEHVKGMIFFPYSGNPGQIGFMNDGTQSLDVWMSAYEMGGDDLWEVIRFYRNESHNDVGVSVEGVESDWYIVILSYPTFVIQVILIVLSVICIFYNVFLLIAKLRTFSRFNLSLMCLSLDLCSSILKLTWKCSAWGRTYLYIWWLQLVLYSWWIPFQITSLTMVLFYWNKRLKKSNYAVMSIEKKYIQWITCILALLFVMELVSSLTRVFLANTVLYNFAQVVYVLTLIVIMGYIILTKYSIWKYKTDTKTVLTFGRTLQKMNIVLDCTCVSILAILVFQLIRIVIRSVALFSIVSWTGIFLLSDVISISISYIFHPKHIKSSGATTDHNSLQSGKTYDRDVAS